ncbi:MAG: hypothetical protein MZV65_28680 [Chromatiales bacterium]|nr:hypothetical protein [Chromatiales bacterium]
MAGRRLLRTLTDDGANLLVGPGYGVVDYATGALWFKPSLLPDPNTQPLLEFQSRTTHTENFTPTMDGNGFVSMTLANTPIKPGSVSIRWETKRTKTQTEKSNNTVGQVGYASTNSELSSSNESSWVRRTYSDGQRKGVLNAYRCCSGQLLIDEHLRSDTDCHDHPQRDIPAETDRGVGRCRKLSALVDAETGHHVEGVTAVVR